MVVRMFIYLEYASQCKDKSTSGADQEDGGNVEQERDRRVGEEDRWADVPEFLKWRPPLRKWQDGQVDDSTDLRGM